MEGATPAGGGKASAAVFRQACLVENAALAFGRLRRPRRSRPHGEAVGKREAQRQRRRAEDIPLAEGEPEGRTRYNGNNSFQALPGTLEVIVL